MNFNVITNIVALVAMFFYEITTMLDSHPNISFVRLSVVEAIKLLAVITLSAIYKTLPLLLVLNIVCNSHNT